MSENEKSKVMLQAVEECPPDTFCGIARKPAWNIDNAAKMLNVSVPTVRNWVTKAKNGEGSIPYYQKTANAPIFFPIRELIEWDSKGANK